MGKSSEAGGSWLVLGPGKGRVSGADAASRDSGTRRAKRNKEGQILLDFKDLGPEFKVSN